MIHGILWLASVVLFVLKVAGVGAVASASWWLVAAPALLSLVLVVVAGLVGRAVIKSAEKHWDIG